MGLWADWIAIRDRTDITGPEKRRLGYDLKGQAIVNALTSKVGQTFTRGVYTATLTRNPEYDQDMVILRGVRLTKNGVVVLDESTRWPSGRPKLPICIVSPPILVPDGLGGFKEDVLQAFRDMLMDLAG